MAAHTNGEYTNGAHTNGKETYLLDRSREETERLDEQHYFIVKLPFPTQNYIWQMLGYLVHPLVERKCLSPSQNAEKASVPRRIADIGTGSGTFLLDLSRQLPSASFHGFDISSKQFPGPSDIPSNVSFHVHDAKTPFSPELHGTFDMVHVRYLTLGLPTPQDWETVATNVLALLKPGGGIQWTEPNVLQLMRILRGGSPAAYNSDVLDPDDRDGGLTFVDRQFKKWVEVFRSNIVQNIELRDIFKRKGLQDVWEDAVGSDRLPELRAQVTHNVITAWESSMRIAIASGSVKGMKVVEIDGIVSKLRKYADKEIYLRYDAHTFIGFKQDE